MKRARVQKGSVVCNKRYGAWNFLWFDEQGSRRSRKLGSISELSREQALKKANAVTLSDPDDVEVLVSSKVLTAERAAPILAWGLTTPEALVDDSTAAHFLGGLHPKTVQRMARSGRLPAYRVGKYWRYRASELDEWLQLQSTGRIARVVSTKEKP